MSRTVKKELPGTKAKSTHFKMEPVGHAYVEWRVAKGKSGVRKASKHKIQELISEAITDS